MMASPSAVKELIAMLKTFLQELPLLSSGCETDCDEFYLPEIIGLVQLLDNHYWDVAYQFRPKTKPLSIPRNSFKGEIEMIECGEKGAAYKGISLPLTPNVAAPRQRFFATPSPELRPGACMYQEAAV